MTVEILENTKCVCDSCKGTGIDFCYDNDTKGLICPTCIGSGYRSTLRKVYKIGNEYFERKEDTLYKIVPFVSKIIIPNLKFVTFHNPYREDILEASLISYSEFLNGMFPVLSKSNGCPLDYLDLLECDFDVSVCPHDCNQIGFSNYLDDCPIKENTQSCWDTIKHPVLKKINSFKKR